MSEEPQVVVTSRAYRFIPVVFRLKTVTRTLVKRPSATTAMAAPADISHCMRCESYNQRRRLEIDQTSYRELLEVHELGKDEADAEI